MVSKVHFYSLMAEQAAKQITGSFQQWTSFLSTASRLYKYPYPDQLMIHIQRPDATACAEYELWSDTMGRYVKRGAKGIALLDCRGEQPRLRYVFDVSDTGARENSRPVILWEMREEYRRPVQDALERACWRRLPVVLQKTIGRTTGDSSSTSLRTVIWRSMMRIT